MKYFTGSNLHYLKVMPVTRLSILEEQEAGSQVKKIEEVSPLSKRIASPELIDEDFAGCSI